jgi:FkbM family methyltransferase
MLHSHPLTRQAPMAAWLRFAAWQFRSRLGTEIIVPWVGGQRLAVQRGMTGATGNIYVGLHEFMSMALTLHFLREGELFLDIGANVGSYTVLASGVCRATTWAFEPDVEARRHLERNVQLNGLEARTKILACAVGPVDATVRFTTGRGTLNQVAPEGCEVPQRALDGLPGAEHAVMMKIDAEGYGAEVLQGARGLIAGSNLKVISQEETTPEMHELLTAHGFERSYYDPFTRSLQRTPNDLWLKDGQWTMFSNEDYVRDWEFVARRLRSAPPIEVFGRLI